MESLYASSVVVVALRDALKELTDAAFIKREIAEVILAEGCKAVHTEFVRAATTRAPLPNAEVNGHLRLYRYRKNAWTLYIQGGELEIGMGMPEDSVSTRRSSKRLRDEDSSDDEHKIGPAVVNRNAGSGTIRAAWPKHQCIKVVAVDSKLFRLAEDRTRRDLTGK